MVELMPPCGMKVLNLQMTPSERSEGHRGRVGNPGPIGLLAHKGRSLWLSHLPHVMTKLKVGEAIFYDTENGYPSWALAVGGCLNKNTHHDSAEMLCRLTQHGSMLSCDAGREKAGEELGVRCGCRSVKHTNQSVSENAARTYSSPRCESWFSPCGGNCKWRGPRKAWASFPFPSTFSSFLNFL